MTATKKEQRKKLEWLELSYLGNFDGVRVLITWRPAVNYKATHVGRTPSAVELLNVKTGRFSTLRSTALPNRKNSERLLRTYFVTILDK